MTGRYLRVSQKLRKLHRDDFGVVHVYGEVRGCRLAEDAVGGSDGVTRAGGRIIIAGREVKSAGRRRGRFPRAVNGSVVLTVSLEMLRSVGDQGELVWGGCPEMQGFT